VVSHVSKTGRPFDSAQGRLWGTLGIGQEGVSRPGPRAYILDTRSISEEELESLTQAASLDAEIRASAHKLFSKIFERLDEPGTHAVIYILLSLKRPAGRLYC
jgi:hypothetical protein